MLPKISYFDIAWLSHCDGPGYRLVLFLQGCHLHCPWCHSPHSQPLAAPLLFFPARCLRCGRCEQACPQSVHRVSAEGHDLQRQNCRHCGKCVDACPVSNRERLNGALALPTRKITVADLWDLLYPQLDLLRDIGGITISGGEPLLQSLALQQLLLRCQQDGIHTAVETSGALSIRHVSDLIKVVDCWLFGLRPTPFYKVPRANLIEEALAFITNAGSRVIIRMPVVAGITDLSQSLESIASIMQTYGLTDIELLPFHEGTFHYYEASGLKCTIGREGIPSVERLRVIKEFFEQGGFEVKIPH